MITYIKEKFFLCLLLCATLLIGCSDDNETISALPQGQGEVTFKFVRNNIYTISSLEEMARLKVTLEKDGKQLVLPTIDLSGNKDSLSTAAVRIDNGMYKVVKYVAYNVKGALIQEAYLDEDNALEVTHGQISHFYFPLSIRLVYTNHALRNTLYGICREVIGNDSTQWPKSWREENEDMSTWENLEFQYDDYGRIMYLASITFDNKFAGMRKMPEAVGLITTLEGVQVMDLPEFEELPDNIYKSGMGSISLINTSFKAFPKRFEEMKGLVALSVRNSKMTELPARLSKLEDLLHVDFSGNEIATFPSELAQSWQKVIMLRMTNTKLTSLPENMFDMQRVSTFDLSDNPGLSSLPESRPAQSAMRGLILNGCGFSTLPKIAHGQLNLLALANNKLTSLSEADVNALSPSLQGLILNGNNLGSFPKMKADKLTELSLNNCGLTSLPDLSALPLLGWLQVANNQITQVKAGTFTFNKVLSLLNLSGNKTLTTLSEDAGFNLVEQEDIKDGSVVKVAKPFYLRCVNVDECPALLWTVPATWCCIKNIHVVNKPDKPLASRNVVVYNRNSPGVTRQACTQCGKSVYVYPQTLEELLAELKAAQ